MDKDEAISILRQYQKELTGILERFKRTSDAISIDHADDPRFRQLIIELRDFLNDNLREESYPSMIIRFFNEGIDNYFGSPSYKSVENIRGVVLSAITRIERNQKILKSFDDEDIPPIPPLGDLDFPQKITLAWLVRHVPVMLWISAAALLIGSFVAGVQASRLSLVKEFFDLKAEQRPLPSPADDQKRPILKSK